MRGLLCLLFVMSVLPRQAFSDFNEGLNNWLKFEERFYGYTFECYDQLYFYLYKVIDVRHGYAGICEVDPECVRVANGPLTTIHCEGKLHASVKILEKDMTVQCNSSLSSEQLRLPCSSYKHYPQRLYFMECPEPRLSYASLFPQPQLLFKIIILCGERERFYLEKKHFKGVHNLEMLTINCPALSHLPKDFFLNTISLESLDIDNTRIELLPDKLFEQLRKLHSLKISSSRLKRIQNEAFIGLENLRYLSLGANNITHMGEKSLDSVGNIEELDLSNNSLSALPESLKKLSKLRWLNVGHNLILEIKPEFCLALFSLKGLLVDHNRMTIVDPLCLSGLKNLSVIDLSGNSIIKLDIMQTEMDNLEKFFFSDNSKLHQHLPRFLNSPSLEFLYMSNSHIDSLEPDALYDMRNLYEIDLSGNNITEIAENFFSRCRSLAVVYLQRNAIFHLSPKIFLNNPNLTQLNVSFNELKILPPELLANNRAIKMIDFSVNSLESFPEPFLLNLGSLVVLNLTRNMLQTLRKGTFSGMDLMETLDLSWNALKDLPMDVFLSSHQNCSLKYLWLQGNKLSFIPSLKLNKLEQLNLDNNMLTTIGNEDFHGMPTLSKLSLSRNRLNELPEKSLVVNERLLHLDLSFNNLRTLPILMFRESPYNLLKCKPRIHMIPEKPFELVEYCAGLITPKWSCNLKVLDISNNVLTFDDAYATYDTMTETWGSLTHLVQCPKLEEVNLSHNLIKRIFLDWRIMLPSLRILNLTDNKVEFLTNQEMLFASAYVDNSGNVSPHVSSHSLTVDLRRNNIKALDLQPSMLMSRHRRCDTRKLYGHVTILLEENPFVCGCGILNLLRVLNNELVLTSELYRTEGKNWILPAKLEAGNLSCWEPMSLRGKKIMEPEEWMHHVIPMIGLCALA